MKPWGPAANIWSFVLIGHQGAKHYGMPTPHSMYCAKVKTGHFNPKTLLSLRNIIHTGFHPHYPTKPGWLYHSFENSSNVFRLQSIFCEESSFLKPFVPLGLKKTLLQCRFINWHFIHFNRCEFPKPLFVMLITNHFLYVPQFYHNAKV